MARYPGAVEFLPARHNLTALRAGIESCRGCDLYRDATQAVFGEGLKRSRLIMIGETPGDVEDRTGRPFTGPAGRLLDKALEVAGLERSELFLTNAVKHFRYETRGATGKRRIHKTPSQAQITACLPWLEAELDVVRPEGAVVMGSVAGHALFGSDFRVGDHRGRVSEPPDRQFWSVVTIHPSAALRADDRAAAFDGLVADLRLAAERLTG
ncbi:UdgX family uracil-DNA binding protein [Microlunatus sp. Gsoil 973]|jgi:DNA polymerase|uniref:UdgX family uracil-DNA binding protein n=1 Tax=Microlunatus sp. Gsoil 973 TaxID=2672569 RepID=UPI0012B46C95|nr:UdgX family uracil-DNA binding protein [Microlunatus sp. Gsoil 973]QGN34074.1 UdgX family uracil-DNA binding protein [Microlunatus sp. Gsoil 973]